MPTPAKTGPYRVVADVNPRQSLGDNEYPVTDARIEIGFQLQTGEAHEYYWFNWIEPERSLLVGWHQVDILLRLKAEESQPRLGS